MKHIIKLLTITLFFFNSCNNDAEKNNGEKRHVDCNRHNNTIIINDADLNRKLKINFRSNGSLKKIEIYAIDRPKEKQILTFHNNENLDNYRLVRDHAFKNHSISLDSINKGLQISIPSKTNKGPFINQTIRLDVNGNISMDGSYFLLFNGIAIHKDNKLTISLDIKIVGMKYDLAYAIIGDYDSLYNPISNNLDTFYSDGDIIHCEIPATYGDNEIRGTIVDYSTENNKVKREKYTNFTKVFYL